MLINGFLCSLLVVPACSIIYLIFNDEKRLIETNSQDLTVEIVGTALQKLTPGSEPDYSLLRFDQVDLKEVNGFNPSLFKELDLWQMCELFERLEQLEQLERLEVLTNASTAQLVRIAAVANDLRNSYQKALQPSPTFWALKKGGRTHIN